MCSMARPTSEWPTPRVGYAVFWEIAPTLEHGAAPVVALRVNVNYLIHPLNLKDIQGPRCAQAIVKRTLIGNQMG